jgi:hypothetical protein
MTAVLRAKWRMLLSLGGKGRGLPGSASIGLALFGLALGVLVFFLANGFFVIVDRVAPGSAGGVLSAMLVLLALVLLASAATVAYNGFYASSDLTLLLSWPLSPRQVFGIKLVEVLAAEAGTFLVLGLPVLAAYGAAAGAPLWFFAVLPLVAVVFHFLPTGLALLLNLLAMRLIPAHRAREVGLALGAILGAVVYGAVQLAPAAMGTASVADLGLASSRLASPYLPTTWLADGVAGAAGGHLGAAAAGIGASALAGGLLLAAALALVPAVFASGWIGEPRRGRTRVRAGRPASGRPVRGRNGHPIAGLARKEVLTVVRDAAEWSQALYGLVFLAVLVLSNRLAAGDGGSAFRFGPVMVYFLASFLAVMGVGPALGVGAVAREGKARWFPLSAPLTRREWLGAKVAGGVFLSGPLAAIGALTVGLAVGHLPWHELISVLAASVAAVPGGMAISVYVGAQNPVFDAPDPRRRVTTSAGMSHFLLQALYLGATSLLLSLALAAARWAAGGFGAWLGGAGAWVGPLVGPVEATAVVGVASWLVTRGCLSGAAAATDRWE